MAKQPPNIGDTVKLTGKFLASTGQTRGGEGPKRWKVLGFTGPDKVWAIVDEDISADGYFNAEELAADPTLKWRRIAWTNLQVVGKVAHSSDEPKFGPEGFLRVLV